MTRRCLSRRLCLRPDRTIAGWPPAVARCLCRACGRFALAGMIAGLAAALLLPASLSESLPGTSGNDRAPVQAAPSRAQGSARRGEKPPARLQSRRAAPLEREQGAGVRSHVRYAGDPLAVGAGALSGTGSRASAR